MAPQHLLSIDDLDRAALERLLDGADDLAAAADAGAERAVLAGRTVALLFPDDAVRTRLGIESAARRLGAEVTTVAAGSAQPEPSLRSTARLVADLGVDAVVARHRCPGEPGRLAGLLSRAAPHISVVNAGDGAHQHPTQALVDCHTVRSLLGRVEGLRVALVGDIEASGLARSLVGALSRLGAEVVLVAPPTLLPLSLAGWPVTVSSSLDAVVGSVDVCRVLPVRPDRADGRRLPSLRDYAIRFALDAERAERLRDDALVLHPGVEGSGEIAAAVADRPFAVDATVAPGALAVRQAVLAHLLAPSGAAAAPPGRHSGDRDDGSEDR